MTTSKKVPRVVESLPSVQGGISALASATAPFVFFNGVAVKGVAPDGIAQLELAATRLNLDTETNEVFHDHVIVAHLRCSLPTLRDLRVHIDEILKSAEPFDRTKAN